MKSMEKSRGIFKEKSVSRRGLLSGAGKIAAGVAGITLASAGGMSLISKAHARTAKFPWGYKKIDPVRAGEIAYKNYHEKFCCYGVASGILIPLQEDIGEPFTLFPLEATIWGHGGAIGWGTLCGTLNGAGTALALIAGKEGEKILNDVITWYTKTNFPIYTPSNPKADIKTTSKSNSPLCHISVGKWLKKEGVDFFSSQLRERCGRLTADIAMKTVELLNDWDDGNYKQKLRSQVEKHKMPTGNRCQSCHGKKVPKVRRKA